MTDLDRTFRDPATERRFQRDGFVVVPFVPADVLARLRERYEALRSGIDDGYYASIHSTDSAYKAAADAAIRELCWQPFADLLVDHEPIVGAFMVKHPGAHTAVAPHQDWIVTDERVAGAVNCWFPLTPVTPEVGQMAVLRGSHRFLDGLRGSPGFPTQCEDILDEVRDELMDVVPVEVGEAVIYDNRLLHGTPPNRSDATRIVAYLNAIPRGRRRLHYHHRPDGTVGRYVVAPDFFTTFTLGDEPSGTLDAELDRYEVTPIDLDVLRRLQRRALGPRLLRR